MIDDITTCDENGHWDVWEIKLLCEYRDRLRGTLSLAEEGLANYAEEVAAARAAAADIAREAERLRTALRYWLPDETMIPKGHEIAWNEHVELIPEHRLGVPQTGEPT